MGLKNFQDIIYKRKPIRIIILITQRKEEILEASQYIKISMTLRKQSLKDQKRERLFILANSMMFSILKRKEELQLAFLHKGRTQDQF